MLDALALGSEPGATVEPIHRAVERPMRPTQVRRHQVRVVEIGQRRAQMGRTRIEHRLAERPGRRPCGSRCNTTGTGARRSSGALRRRRTAGRQSRAPPVAGQACGAVGATPPRGGHRPSAYRRGRASGSDSPRASPPAHRPEHGTAGQAPPVGAGAAAHDARAARATTARTANTKRHVRNPLPIESIAARYSRSPFTAPPGCNLRAVTCPPRPCVRIRRGRVRHGVRRGAVAR